MIEGFLLDVGVIVTVLTVVLLPMAVVNVLCDVVVDTESDVVDVGVVKVTGVVQGTKLADEAVFDDGEDSVFFLREKNL